MQQFAIGWLIAEIALREGDPQLAGFYLGVRSLASALPSLGVGLIAGVWADQMDRRDLLMRARAASAILAVVLALAAITDHASIAVVVILSAASSAAFAADPPGRQAVLHNVVPPADLFSAVGLARASMQSAQILGPLAAGLLVSPIGVGGVLLVKAALDIASLVALKFMDDQPVDGAAGAMGVADSLREGLGFVRRDRVLFWCVILQLMFSVLALAYVQLLPAIAVDALHVGAQELSWMITAVGIGALAGAAFVAGSGGIDRRGVVMFASMFGIGAVAAVLAVQRDLVPVLIALPLLGFLQQSFMGSQSIILQLTAPDRLRGRVMATQSVIFMSAGPVGVFALGTLGTFIGIANAVFAAGLLVMAVAAIAFARIGVLRDLRMKAWPVDVPATPMDATVAASD